MDLRLLHYSDVENAYDDPERLGRLAGTIQELRDDATLVFGSGDNIAPGVLPLLSRGAQALEFFESVSPHADTFGNHDFDFGPERTLELIERAPQSWLSVNVRLNGSVFGADVGVRPWQIFGTAGARVGVFGLTTPRTSSINPNTGTVQFTNPIPAAERAVEALTKRGVDYVVCLSHLGRVDEALAASVDVDVVLGGHTHAERVKRLDGTLLTRPGVNGKVVLEISLPGQVVTHHDVAEGPLDSDLRDKVKQRLAGASVNEVVAHVEDPIERTESACFRGESRIGNWVADAYRWYTDADVGLQNAGGIRSGPSLAGDVTVGDLISVVPFDEPIALAKVSGAELRCAFRQGEGSQLSFGEPDWWHAHVSGATIEYGVGERELISVTVGGDDLDDNRTYHLAVSDYVLHSDDEFPVLDEHHRVDESDVQYEVLAAYAREVGIDPALEGRVRIS